LNNNSKVIVVIPARGGSKGIPGKNIRVLAGVPLIVHSIRHALQSQLVSDTYVTTDDDEIAGISTAAGAKVIRRPDEYADDKATSESALIHALNTLEERGEGLPDLVVFLQCTSPIRRGDDIDNAINLYREQGADSLLSVVENHRFFWSEYRGTWRSVNYDYSNRQRRQDFAASYMENGSIYISRAAGLRENNNRLFGRIAAYVMGAETMYEIDEELDFTVIEAVMTATAKSG